PSAECRNARLTRRAWTRPRLRRARYRSHREPTTQCQGVPMSSDPFGRAGGLSAPSRRRFVQGLAAGGAVAALGLWPRASRAAQAHALPHVLSGTEFDLTIGETPMNFTGATRPRSEEHTSELQSREKLVCRLLL